jgi:uncharacterized protein
MESNNHMVKEVMFNGPSGRLEGRFHKSEKSNSPIALVLHPHPLHGGTMNNKVVYEAFYALVQMGFSVLRFNFPGVGKSEGEFDHGVGELCASAVAMNWLQERCPDFSACWIAGFSFGSWIGLQLLMRRPEINSFIAISPPANAYDFNFLSPCPTPGLIIHGTKDKIVPESYAYGFYEKLAKQRNVDGVVYNPIEEADHFYKDHLDKMVKAMQDYIINMTKVEPVGKKARRDRKKGISEAA